jgi:hypothetical protein
MDVSRTADAWGHPPASPADPGAQRVPPEDDPHSPRDDDERFIVDLVLTYYRRHPQRARARLLDLLGEVLTPQPAARTAAERPGTSGPNDDGQELWRKTQAAVNPLKSKR